MDKLEMNKIAFKKFSALTNFMDVYENRIKFVKTTHEREGLDFLDHPDDFDDATPDEIHAAKMTILNCAKSILENTPEQMIGKKLAGLIADKLTDSNAILLAQIIRDDPDYTRMDLNAGKSGFNPAAAALGSIRTDKKAAASRENGKLGGRPKKTEMLLRYCIHQDEELEGWRALDPRDGAPLTDEIFKIKSDVVQWVRENNGKPVYED